MLKMVRINDRTFALPDKLAGIIHPPEEDRIRYPRLLKEHLAQPAVPPANLSGSGIVTISFGADYWPMAALSARMLRRTGCTLPLQIWHDGCAKPLDDPLTTLVDARKYLGTKPGAWENKTTAIMNSGFAQVLFLDADVYCVSDPTPAFDMLRFKPFVFWQDLHRNPWLIRWAFIGIEQGGAPVQAGNMLFDVAEAWPLLSTVHWLGQHSEYFYTYVGYGDQDCFIIAMAAHGTPYAMLPTVDAHKFAYVARYDDTPMMVHRFLKLLPGQAPSYDPTLPDEEAVLDVWQELDPKK